MTGLLLRVHLWSWKNRILTRLRRLRQVRYLVFTSLAVAWVLFFWRPWRTLGFLRDRTDVNIRIGADAIPIEFAPAVEVGIAALITFLCVIAWVWPRRRLALEFTEAEIAFLFPAPLTRRQVVDFSLLKDQAGLLFGAFMITIFGIRRIVPSFWQGLLAAWIVFALLHLFFLGCAITRANLLKNRGAGLRRSAPVLAAVASVGALVVAWAVFWLRPPYPWEMEGGAAVAQYLVDMGEAGPMRFLLWPARLVVRPAFVEGGALPLVGSFLPALAMIAACYTWVVRSDFSYEEASAERAARKAAGRRSKRAGGRRYDKVKVSARRPPFPLAVAGRPEVAFLWKNLIAAGRLFSARRMTLGAAAILGLAWLVSLLPRDTAWEAVPEGVGWTCFVLAGVGFLIGPGIFRSDLRSDLLQISLLKTYPLHGGSVVLGEVLAPTLLISGFQTILIGMALILTDRPFGLGPQDLAMLVLGFLVLAVPLNLLSCLVQNAAVLIFPSWHVIGPQRAKGLEAFGQRLVGLFLFVLVLALVYLPTGLILGGGLFLAYPFLGMTAVPLMAAAATLPSLLEGLAGVLGLGLLFERFDASRELDVGT